ncbi:enhancer of split malpha protein-like [Aphidius gifuensis]|uniref:enhancer of split malpha protein-like n=1 Tax=Aphidius gifuensis TaxID=684658 RepID=UPI001CDB6A1F|nr:enhancer of split malpha protein-like [Aphidius gifuensis]
MATTISHVIEYENELNDNLYNLKMSIDNNNNNIIINNNNNKKVSNARRMRKMLKPLLRYLKKKSSKLSKINQKSKQQKFEIFTEEVDNQNNCNEALEQRLITDLENADEGAAITVCLDGQMIVVPVVPGHLYVPVHFAHTQAGDFYWTHITPTDNDICYKELAFSQHQLPEMQVA